MKKSVTQVTDFFHSESKHFHRVVNGENEQQDRQHPGAVERRAADEQRRKDRDQADGKHRVCQLIIRAERENTQRSDAAVVPARQEHQNQQHQHTERGKRAAALGDRRPVGFADAAVEQQHRADGR